MGNRIEAIVEDVDLRLKITGGQSFRAYGIVTLSFQCPKCYKTTRTVLNYQGEHPADTERKCEHCEEPYSVTNTISIIPDIGDREVVNINKQMKPIIDRIKKGDI